MSEMTQEDGPTVAVGREDPLLGCLVFLTQVFERPKSPEVLMAGIADVGEGLTPTEFVRAADRVGLHAEVVKRKARQLEKLELPAVLILNNGKACVLLRFLEDDQLEVALPDARGTVRAINRTQVTRAYLGFAIQVRVQAEFGQEDEHTGVVEEGGHWFWSALSANWWVYSQVAVGAFLVNIFALATPIFVMTVYDRVVPNDAIETLWVLTIGVLTVFLFDLLIKTARSYLIDHAGKRTDVNVASRLFDQVLDVQMAHRPQASGAFANTLQQFESLRDFFTSATVATLVDIPFVVIFLLALYFIGGPIAGLVIGAVIITVVGTLLLQIPLRSAVRKAYKEGTSKHALLVESLSGLETIKSVGAESRVRHKWESAVAQTAETGAKSRFYSMLANNFTMFMMQVTTVGIVAVAVWQVKDGEMTMGGMIAAMILGGRTMQPLAQIANLLTRMHQAIASLKGLNQLMALPRERPPRKAFLHRSDLAGGIEFKDVSFAYPRSEVMALSSVSFSLPPGDRVAILGRVGSGKSTVNKLVLGLYQPQQGSVLIDGTDQRQIDPTDLRRNVGYLPQDIVLFRGTVRENIAIAAPYADDQMVLRAAELAGVDDFLKRHPQGYDLQIGERGEGLSGGQRQAIGLARALIHNPRILLLDEPTSSMDTAAEESFRSRLQEVLEGRTLILVTHRNALLPLVNHLIVLDNGRLVADGPRDQVIQALSRGKVARAVPGSAPRETQLTADGGAA